MLLKLEKKVMQVSVLEESFRSDQKYNNNVFSVKMTDSINIDDITAKLNE